jgi:hypothetical protein
MITLILEFLQKNGKDDKVLYLQKYKVHSGENTFEVIVDQKPEVAGIDPMNKYDRSR